MKLESLSNRIEELEKSLPIELNNATTAEMDRVFVRRVISHQRFLKQPLTLGMFVPCDLDGNVLKEPILTYPFYTPRPIDERNFERRKKEYQQAQERVLFKGFTHVYKNTYSVIKYKDKEFIEDSFFAVRENVERLINLDVELTPNAIKQLK